MPERASIMSTAAVQETPETVGGTPTSPAYTLRFRLAQPLCLMVVVSVSLVGRDTHGIDLGVSVSLCSFGAAPLDGHVPVLAWKLPPGHEVVGDPLSVPTAGEDLLDVADDPLRCCVRRVGVGRRVHRELEPFLRNRKVIDRREHS